MTRGPDDRAYRQLTPQDALLNALRRTVPEEMIEVVLRDIRDASVVVEWRRP